MLQQFFTTDHPEALAAHRRNVDGYTDMVMRGFAFALDVTGEQGACITVAGEPFTVEPRRVTSVVSSERPEGRWRRAPGSPGSWVPRRSNPLSGAFAELHHTPEVLPGLPVVTWRIRLHHYPRFFVIDDALHAVLVNRQEGPVACSGWVEESPADFFAAMDRFNATQPLASDSSTREAARVSASS